MAAVSMTSFVPISSHSGNRPVPDGAFHTTQWTVVLAARGNSPQARAALSTLCEAYYQPVLAYLARALRDPSLARDVAHDFFASLLEGDRLSQLSRDGGKFRAYLSGALKHFLSHRRAFERRSRRGGGIAPVSLPSNSSADTAFGPDLVDERAEEPDEAFDRAWATTLVARALSTLRAECEAEGSIERFEQLKPWLTGDAAFGEQAETARRLQLDSNTLKAAVHRLKKRFRQLIKNEISSTLSSPADVDEEMRALFAALST